MLRNENVIKAFNNSYTDLDTYKLVVVCSRENYSTYILIDTTEIILEFTVNDNRVIDARSHGGLLSSKLEIKQWYLFIKLFEEYSKEN